MVAPYRPLRQQMSMPTAPMSAVGLDDLDEELPAEAARPRANGQGGAPAVEDLGTSGELAPAPQQSARPPFPGDPAGSVADGIRRTLEGPRPSAQAERQLPNAGTSNVNLAPLEPFSQETFRPELGGSGGMGLDLGGSMGTGRNPFLPDALAARDQEATRLQRASAMQSQALQGEAGIYDSQARAQVPIVAGQMRVLGDARSYAMQKREQLEAASNMYADAVIGGVNPDRLFDSGRLNRVQALISAGASGAVDFYFNQGQGGNKTLSLIDRMIDRDIALQEADIQNRGQYADNMLAQLQVALGDKEDAYDAFRSMYLSLMEKETQAAMTRTADARQRSQLEVALGSIQNAKADLLLGSEEKFLDRRLTADKANLQQRNALQMKAMETRAKFGERASADMQKFTEKYGGLVDLTRQRDEFMKLLTDAQAKFGKIPGLGVIEGGGVGRRVIKTWDDLTQGPDAPTDPEQMDYALRIAQMGAEVDQLAMSAFRTAGAQSDFDAANILGAYAVKGRGERDTKEMLERGRRNIRNLLVRDSKTNIADGNARRYWFEQTAPDFLQEDPAAGGVEKRSY
jgi:hypothetical protein